MPSARFLPCLLAALLALGAPVRADHPGHHDDPPRLTVEGEGSIDVAPDMATVRLGVVAEARGAREAIDEMSRSMAGVIARLRELGVAERDIQTSDLSVEPVWDHRIEGEGPRIRGFVARNGLTVKIRDLARLGEALDAVARDGANRFEGVVFGLQDDDPVRDAARREAVADARRKAALYAESAGVGLGPLLRLSEAGRAAPGPVPIARMEMAMASDAVPVAAGELTVTARVTLVYALETAE